MKKVLAKLLPPTTELYSEQRGYTVDVGEVLDSLTKGETEYKDEEFYLTNLENMPKPKGPFVECVGEEMDENQENWLEKNQEALEELEEAVQAVFDLWWDNLSNNAKTVYALDTKVVFEKD